MVNDCEGAFDSLAIYAGDDQKPVWRARSTKQAKGLQVIPVAGNDRWTARGHFPNPDAAGEAASADYTVGAYGKRQGAYYAAGPFEYSRSRAKSLPRGYALWETMEEAQESGPSGSFPTPCGPDD